MRAEKYLHVKCDKFNRSGRSIKEIEDRIKALEDEFDRLGEDVKENLIVIMALKWVLGDGGKC